MKAFLGLILVIGTFSPILALATPEGTPFEEDSLYYKNDHRSMRFNVKAEYDGSRYSVVYIDNVSMASIMEAVLVQKCEEDADVVYKLDIGNSDAEDFIDAEVIEECAEDHLNGNVLATTLSELTFVDDTVPGYVKAPGSLDYPLSRLKLEVKRIGKLAGLTQSEIQQQLDTYTLPQWNQAGALQTVDLALYRLIQIHQFENVKVNKY